LSGRQGERNAEAAGTGLAPIGVEKGGASIPTQRRLRIAEKRWIKR